MDKKPKILPKVDTVAEHPFVTQVFKDSLEVDKSLGDLTPQNVEPSYNREPDEYEFYILKVGSRLAGLIHLCLQLEQVPFYLSNCRITQSMRNARIDRPSYLVYSIENYLIRTQMLYDRVLQLVNAVEHLCNSDENCTHKIIIENTKVKQTGLPPLLVSVRNHLNKYRYPRNQIIHVRSYTDNDIRPLAIISSYLTVDSDSKDSNTPLSINAPKYVNYKANEIVRDTKLEYTRFNTKLFERTVVIFDELKVQYEQMKKRLSEA